MPPIAWGDVNGERLSLNQRLLSEIQRHMLATAPPGVDVASWRY
jgi:hypothetical protein